MKKIFYSAIALCIALGAQAQVVDFENVETMEGDLTLNADNYQQNFFDEEEEEGLFMSGKFVFSNYYMADRSRCERFEELCRLLRCLFDDASHAHRDHQ